MESTVEIITKAKLGAQWVILGSVFGQGLSFTASVILARILAPKDFGIVGIALIFTEISYIVANLGLGSALVQTKCITDEHKHVAFLGCVMVGTVETVLLLGVSRLVGRLFASPLAATVMAYLSFQIVLTAASTTPRALLQRQLQFKELTLLQIICGAVHGTIAIVFAIQGFGIWSLVWPPLVASGTGVLLAFRLARYVPKPVFRWRILAELLRFGSLLTVKNAFLHFRRKADHLLIGKFLGEAPLGLYSRAVTLVTRPQSALHRVVHTVSFPSFALVQSDLNLLGAWYQRAASLVALVVVPTLLGLCAVADDFVLVLFTAKWAGMIVPLRIMCVAGILTAIASLATTALEATDNVRFEIWVEFACGLTTAAGALMGLRWGIDGVALAILAAAALSFLGRGYLLRTRLHLPLHAYVSVLWAPVLCSLVMVGFIAALRLVTLAPHVRLAVSLIGGALAYALLILVMGRKQYGFLISEVTKLIVACSEPRRVATNGQAGVCD